MRSSWVTATTPAPYLPIPTNRKQEEMSNVNGRLECLNDGTGRVTADVEGTGVAVSARVSLNGQDERTLGPGNHSYTLFGTFQNGAKVDLIITREGGVRQIGVLTVDCPQPTPTTEPPVTPPLIVTPPPPPQIGTSVSVAPPDTQTLPETGGTLQGALAAGGIMLAGAFLIAAAFQPKRRKA